MITALTQTAMTVLIDISCKKQSQQQDSHSLSHDGLLKLLLGLELSGLIRLLPDQMRGDIPSYELTRPIVEITLLDVLGAIGENLNCNSEAGEDMYFRYGTGARKLGIINYMTRHYLSEIKLVDL